MKPYVIISILLVASCTVFTTNAVAGKTGKTGKTPGATTAAAPSMLTASLESVKPFEHSATVNYNLEEASEVSATLYNNVGQPVAELMANRMHHPGSYQLQISGKDLKPGLYFLRFDTHANPTVVRMVKAME